MENTSYGINVANRYDLFSIDDEGDDPFQTVTQNRQKLQKKNQPGASTTAENVPKTAVKKAKNAEKENKTTQNKIVNNENRHPEKNVDGKTSVAVASSTTSQAQRGEKHGIRETQKDNIRTTREDANKNGYAAKTTERRQPNKSNFPGAENREERNNRKNRDVNNEESGQRKSQTGNRRTEIRGKREFDRQSGSNKTGVKAVEKRDGTGAHNWGSVKVDAKDYSNFQEDYTPQDVDEEKAVTTDQAKEEQSDQTEPKLPVEEDLKEMTLDEWKAQTAAARTKPRYNLRKAGEGEDSNQWDNMVALDKKKTEIETEDDNETQKTGKQRQVLDIEFHFNDNRRGGMMGRPRGRGKGPRNPTKREGDNKKEAPEPRENEGEKRERRNRPPVTTENQKPAKQSSRFKTSAPKVDDEHDFPSLG